MQIEKNHAHNVKNDDKSIGRDQELWESLPALTELPHGAHGEWLCLERATATGEDAERTLLNAFAC